MIAISLGHFTPLLDVGFDHLPDELIEITLQYLDLSSLQVFARTCNRFRDAVRFLDLDRESSRSYIANADGYRNQVNGARPMHRTRTRLNLGEDFSTYMKDAEFRTRVDALVANALQQIWSDVTYLYLSDTQVQDIRPLAELVNLYYLDVRNTRVSQPAVLALERTRPRLRIHR